MSNQAEIKANQEKIYNYEREITALEKIIFEVDHKIAGLLLEQTKIKRKFEHKYNELDIDLNELKYELARTETQAGEDEVIDNYRNHIQEIEKAKIHNHRKMDEEMFSTIKKLEELKLSKDNVVNQINRLIDKKSSISKENFDLQQLPSYHVKLTLNHEENTILEELVKEKGSNKASVLRQILLDHKSLMTKINELTLRLENESIQNKLTNDNLKDLYELKIQARDETIKSLREMRSVVDIKLEQFKAAIGQNVSIAQNRFNDAIDDIDKSIKQLMKTKESLLISNKNISTANKKANSIRIDEEI